MRLTCFYCGKKVSSELPKDFAFSAIAECAECITTHGDKRKAQLDKMTKVINCLALELPSEVYDAVRRTWNEFKQTI